MFGIRLQLPCDQRLTGSALPVAWSGLVRSPVAADAAVGRASRHCSWVCWLSAASGTYSPR